MVASVNRKPDPLTFDAGGGKKGICLGTPLHRLQAINEDPDAVLLAGDVRDVLNQCDPKDKVVARLVEGLGDKKKGDPADVRADDVKHLTAMLVG